MKFEPVTGSFHEVHFPIVPPSDATVFYERLRLVGFQSFQVSWKASRGNDSWKSVLFCYDADYASKQHPTKCESRKMELNN